MSLEPMSHGRQGSSRSLVDDNLRHQPSFARLTDLAKRIPPLLRLPALGRYGGHVRRQVLWDIIAAQRISVGFVGLLVVVVVFDNWFSVDFSSSSALFRFVVFCFVALLKCHSQLFDTNAVLDPNQ